MVDNFHSSKAQFYVHCKKSVSFQPCFLSVFIPTRNSTDYDLACSEVYELLQYCAVIV